MAQGQFKDWGVPYDSSIKRGDGSTCPVCDWDLVDFSSGHMVMHYQAIVGFTTHQPARTASALILALAEADGIDVKSSERIGIVIIECQRCFNKYWHHTTTSGYESKKTICPQWPKD